ncbi:MAG TPA: MFS transporter [Nocardioides sp.]|nr:MFS transporter [Nocardioides sp.]
MALATFGLGVNGFVIAGILQPLAEELHITVATAGQSVTVFGVVYAIAAPLMARVTSSASRRAALGVTLAVFALASVATALAPSFGTLMLSRAAAGIAAAAITPLALSTARELVPPDRANRAVAMVLGGMTTSIVFGVPAGTILGNAVSWRATMLLVAAISAIAGVAVTALIPTGLRGPAPASAPAVSTARNLGAIANLAVTVTWMTGGIAVLTYASVVFAHVDRGHDRLPVLLFVFGGACVVGNWAGGYASDKWSADATAAASLVLTAVSLTGLAVLTVTSPPAVLHTWIVLAAVAGWGFGDWSVTPPQVARLLRHAPDRSTLILAWNSSAIYIGVSLGALLGGLLIAHAGPVLLPLTGAALQVLALAVVLATWNRHETARKQSSRCASPAPSATRSSLADSTCGR